jgi:putative intracellular protease/amidase
MTVLLFDGFTALDIVGGYEVLARVPGVEVGFAAASPGVVAADTRRLGILAHTGLAEVTGTDILYVPGGPGVDVAMADPDLLAWVRKMHEGATWTVGICNGVGILAAAGILNGITVTTNLGWRERVAAYGVTVVPERFHRHGSIITGAGVSASIDAGLFFANLIAGEWIAQLIQLGIEYFPSPPTFARASLSDVPQRERELLLGFEADAVRQLATTVAPWQETG